MRPGGTTSGCLGLDRTRSLDADRAGLVRDGARGGVGVDVGDFVLHWGRVTGAVALARGVRVRVGGRTESRGAPTVLRQAQGERTRGAPTVLWGCGWRAPFDGSGRTESRGARCFGGVGGGGPSTQGERNRGGPPSTGWANRNREARLRCGGVGGGPLRQAQSRGAPTVPWGCGWRAPFDRLRANGRGTAPRGAWGGRNRESPIRCAWGEGRGPLRQAQGERTRDGPSRG